MKIVNLIENTLGVEGCVPSHGLSTVIYMQREAGGGQYGYDGAEKGYHYIGIDKELLELPQVRLLDGDAVIDDELSLFCVQDFAVPATH